MFRRGCRSRRRNRRSPLRVRPCLAPCAHSVDRVRSGRRNVARRGASNSPTRRSTGRPQRARGSPMRFMKDTDCSRSVFPDLRRIRPSWCSRRRWPRSRRRSRATGRICRRECRLRRAAVRRAARVRHLRRRGPFRLPRRIVDGRRDLRRRHGRARRRRERRPIPPRLVPRRRHRRRQGPPGRRHPARQLAEGPPPRGLGLQIRQADRGRAARLVGARHGAACW